MMKHVQKLSKIEGSVGSVSNNQFDPSTAQSSFVLCSELSFGLPLDDGERCRSLRIPQSRWWRSPKCQGWLKHAETGFVGDRPVTSPRVSTDSVPVPSQTPPELPGQVSSTGWKVAKIFGVSWMKVGLCSWVSNVWTNDVSLAEKMPPKRPKTFSFGEIKQWLGNASSNQWNTAQLGYSVRVLCCGPQDISYHHDAVPLLPHKAVAEVSGVGHYRRGWLLWITDGRANPLMDRKVVGVVFFGMVAMVGAVTSPTLAGCSVV